MNHILVTLGIHLHFIHQDEKYNVDIINIEKYRLVLDILLQLENLKSNPNLSESLADFKLRGNSGQILISILLKENLSDNLLR